ncbi:MAG: hypothetical protein IKX60_04000 [Bacteroidales bacterium]|nr:hypothetical protein [Bacteroidales bacterium]
MKRAIYICLLIGGLMMTSCYKADSPVGINNNIFNLVLELEPASVDEYLYNSQTVFLFDTWSGPDDFTYLYSDKGKVMAAFGGFSGNGDGRCADFAETATFIRTIYLKGRWLAK